MKKELKKRKKGDVSSLRKLYAAGTRSDVLRDCHKYSCATDAAEDVRNEAIIAVWENSKPERFNEPEDRLKAYHHSICKNKFLNAKRSKKNAPEFCADYDLETLPCVEADADAAVDRQRLYELLMENFQRLSRRERKLLELFIIKEEKMKDIARIMDFKSVDAVRREKYEALKKLKKLMWEYGDLLDELLGSVARKKKVVVSK
jgi:RNA polymerase sigma factor (sigma-70 family)